MVGGSSECSSEVLPGCSSLSRGSLFKTSACSASGFTLLPVRTASAVGLAVGGDSPAMFLFCLALRVRSSRSCFRGGSFSPLYLPVLPGRSLLIRRGFCFLGVVVRRLNFLSTVQPVHNPCHTFVAFHINVIHVYVLNVVPVPDFHCGL